MGYSKDPRLSVKPVLGWEGNSVGDVIVVHHELHPWSPYEKALCAGTVLSYSSGEVQTGGWPAEKGTS